MNFCSDNVTGAAPEILEAMRSVAAGPAMPYGDDPLTQDVSEKLCEVFECGTENRPEIRFMATGSSANALAVACMTPPWGSVFCHPESHVNSDECGAPEFFTGGAKLVPVPGAHGKIEADVLAEALGRAGAGVVHHVQPATVSITQPTEAGTLYTPEEIAAIADVCRSHNVKLHMDGARFGNAVVALDCTPADISWRAGVDALAFGATKNGAACAESVLFFDPELARESAFRRKRAGHLFSKMRFISAQFAAYLEDDLWLANARHANIASARIAAGLAPLPGVALEHPVDANTIFARLPEAMIEGLLAEGFAFYRWEPEGTLIRLVTAFDTRIEDVDAFLATAARLAGSAASMAAT